MSDTAIDFSEKLRSYLTGRGVSIRYVALECDLPKATLDNWLRGRVTKPRCSWHTIARVALVLNLNGQQATDLLQSAGHPSVAQLLVTANDETDRTLLSRWTGTHLRSLDQTLLAVNERRRQAENWKRLHEDCQDISLKLIVIRIPAQDSVDNVKHFLSDLELHWQLDCSDKVRQFVMLAFQYDGNVKQELAKAGGSNSFLMRLQRAADEMDSIIAECVDSEHLRDRQTDVVSKLRELEMTSGMLLKFLDRKLQTVLRELDSLIEGARESLKFFGEPTPQ